MSLVGGARLGPYEIVSALGAGGMGEVYRARDTKLRRDVAIKVLPAAVRLDPERLARFEREALVLASLNHPNIASIFGVEESPGVVALVLELIDGDTLAARIARGPIAVGEALTIARQIAEALDAAHEKGIVHRDLKPANINITPTGLVKVLDFGLAKIAASPDTSADETQAMGATEGLVIGTAAYMSPEQARGQDVDRRTDIWAFGCVLYEMLTGQRLFAGGGTTDTLALVFTKDPDWNALPPQVPPAIRALLKRCLERDRQKRIGDVAAIRFALEDVASLSAVEPAVESTPRDVHRSQSTTRWVSAILITAGVVGLGAWYLARVLPSRPPASGNVTHLSFSPEGSLPVDGEAVIALSPDGRRLVYVASHDGRQQLYLQELDAFDGTAIRGTEGAVAVTFSPDGNWLAFAADGKIKKVAVAGGEPVELGEFAEGNGSSTLRWESNDSILSSSGPSTGIWRIPAAGGTPTAVTTLSVGELEHHAAQLLPDGKTLLYSARMSSFNDYRVVVQSLATGQRRLIATGTGARYVPPGYLAYVQAGAVYVAPFDLTRLEITGSPVLALQGVRMSSRGDAQVAYSRAGSMTYLAARGNGGPDTLVWVDRSGVEEPTTVSAGAGAIRAPRLAPDLRRVAAALTVDRGLGGNQSDLWLYDLMRNTSSRLTFEGTSWSSVWSPDGTRLAFNLRQSGSEEIRVRTLGSTGQDKRLETNRDTNFPFSWSPDGRFIAGVSVNTTGNHVWVYGVDDPTASRAFVETKLREGGPVFSQDGRWIAYASLKSSRNEIYMRPFPGPGEEWTISTDGGNEPVWARKTGQLFYRHGDAMMAVDITTAPTVVVGKPRKVFERSYNRSDAFWPNYDVSPDGQRFLMIKGSPPLAASRINVLLDWPEELKRLVPTK